MIKITTEALHDILRALLPGWDVTAGPERVVCVSLGDAPIYIEPMTSFAGEQMIYISRGEGSALVRPVGDVTGTLAKALRLMGAL